MEAREYFEAHGRPVLVGGWVKDDGGRAAAGFKGKARDCVCRAIAIATEVPYREVYDALTSLSQSERSSKRRKRSSADGGVHRVTYQKLLASWGWVWTPTMKVGHGCKVHLRADELPPGRLIARLSRHLASVIDGVVHDNHDCSRHGTRCVYGYFSKP